MTGDAQENEETGIRDSRWRRTLLVADNWELRDWRLHKARTDGRQPGIKPPIKTIFYYRQPEAFCGGDVKSLWMPN